MSVFRFSRMLRAAADGAGVSNKMLLTIGSPRESLYLNKPVDSVTVPGVEGYFTLTHNHSLMVSMLKPGVITIREGSNHTEYFISDGFCFFNQGDDGNTKAEISGIEIVPVSALDKDRAAQMITELNAQPKDTEWDRVRTTLATNLLNQVIKFAP